MAFFYYRLSVSALLTRSLRLSSAEPVLVYLVPEGSCAAHRTPAGGTLLASVNWNEKPSLLQLGLFIDNVAFALVVF